MHKDEEERRRKDGEEERNREKQKEEGLRNNPDCLHGDKQNDVLRVHERLEEDKRISLPERAKKEKKCLKKKYSLSLRYLKGTSDGDGGGGDIGGGKRGERKCEKSGDSEAKRSGSFKKKRMNLKVKLSLLSRAISKSERFLHADRMPGGGDEGRDKRRSLGEGGRGDEMTESVSEVESFGRRSETRKSSISFQFLHGVSRLKKGLWKSMDLASEHHSSFGSESSGSCSGGSYSSGGGSEEVSGGQGNGGEGVEGMAGYPRKLHYFHDSIDSAEDALATIEEHRPSLINHTPTLSPISPLCHQTPLPTVVVHLTNKQHRPHRKITSFSDSACSPSMPASLRLEELPARHLHPLLNNTAPKPLYNHHNHHNNFNKNLNHKNAPHNNFNNNFNNHLNNTDNKCDTVQSGPELNNNRSYSEVEEKVCAGGHKGKHKKKGVVKVMKAEKKKKKKTSSWYNVLSPSYKSRSEDFKRIFTTLPSNERLLVEYSCALQKDILIQGRMYVSQTFICFYANIFRWETVVTIKCSGILQLSKEKTARVIPNAIQINTRDDKYFFASFGARDKVFKQLDHVRRNASVDVVMNKAEFWSWVHLYYGDDLGLTSDDDDDYEPLTTADRSKFHLILNSEIAGTICQIEEATEAAVALVTHHKKPSHDLESSLASDSVKKEMNGEEENGGKGGVDDDPANESSADEEIVDYCSRHRHNSIEVVDEAYNMPVSTVFQHIFGDSSIFRQFAKSNKMIDLTLNPWCDVVEGEDDNVDEREKKEKDGGEGVERGKVGKRRQISYTLLLNLSFGPKQSPSREKQVMYAESQPDQFYLIDSDCFNDNIPYGENFYISNRYCISRLSNNRCRLKITSQIKYKKSCWGFVKNFLAKNVTGGINSTFSTLADLLRLESDRHPLLSLSPPSNNSPNTSLDPYHRHCATSQPVYDVTDHVVDSATTSSSPRRLNVAANEGKVSRGISGKPSPSPSNHHSLDAIVRSLCLLMALLLLFNGVFFYKLRNLELTATRLIKSRSSSRSHDNRHHDKNYHSNHHDNAYHTKRHYNGYYDREHSEGSDDSIDDKQLNQPRYTLEEMVKEQMGAPAMSASDWVARLQQHPSTAVLTTPTKARAGSAGKKDEYRALLAGTVRLMDSLRLTVRQLQLQIEDGAGGGEGGGGEGGGILNEGSGVEDGDVRSDL